MSLFRAILNYQFGDNIGTKLEEKFKDNIRLEYSKKTGRLRRIYINEDLFGTVDPTTGFILPTYKGGLYIKEMLSYPKYRVIVTKEAEEYVSKGYSVFCKFVKDLDLNIHAKDIVFIVNEKDELLAVGVSLLSAKEILDFNRGIAIKVKHARVHNSKD